MEERRVGVKVEKKEEGGDVGIKGEEEVLEGRKRN